MKINVDAAKRLRAALAAGGADVNTSDWLKGGGCMESFLRYAQLTPEARAEANERLIKLLDNVLANAAG